MEILLDKLISYWVSKRRSNISYWISDWISYLNHQIFEFDWIYHWIDWISSLIPDLPECPGAFNMNLCCILATDPVSNADLSCYYALNERGALVTCFYIRPRRYRRAGSAALSAPGLAGRAGASSSFIAEDHA